MPEAPAQTRRHEIGELVAVVYHPPGKTVKAQLGRTLLAVAHEAGVDIVSTCGGRGKCTSCRVKLLGGAVPDPTANDRSELGDDDVRDGFRLSCQTTVIGPAEVQIAPLTSETSFQILTGGGTETLASRLTLEPGIWKLMADAKLPTSERQQSSELEEVLLAAGLRDLEIPLGVIKQIPSALTEAAGTVTVTLSQGRLIAVEGGDTRTLFFGLAIDIGTTSVVVELVDLLSGDLVGVASAMNAQTVFGGDIMSRIAFAKKEPTGTQKLNRKIIGLINTLVKEVCEKAGVAPEWIYKVAAVGNTCMHHLFLGINPSHVGFAPYAPIMRHGARFTAREVGLHVHPMAEVVLLPLVGGFVGADTMGMVLATGIYQGDELRMAVDIGTNGEVVLGSERRLMVCSAPAGPALEGAQIKHGMRAALGAIDRVEIAGDVKIHVIGDVPASGICGSGMIDALAACLDAGLLSRAGLFMTHEADRFPPALGRRLRVGDKYREFVVAWAEETSIGQDIVLTQDDVRQLQLAKGAIASGIRMLQRVMGVTANRITNLYLAGGFGNYLNLRNACRIGLIPSIPEDRILYVGNAALVGARRVLLSESERLRVERITREIEHVAIGFHPDFQGVFLEAVGFP